METTVGQLLLNDALPEDMRDYGRVLDKAGLKKLFTELAEKHPDKYREVAQKLSELGSRTAFETGGYSVGLRSLRQSLAAKKMQAELRPKLQQVYMSDVSEEEKDRQILELVSEAQKKLIPAVFEEAKRHGNPLAGQAVSGARGNPVNVNSLLGADMLYADHRGRAMPVPVLRSYAAGLRPAEYFAGAFGARKGIFDLKAATQNAGYFGKQLSQAAHRLLVSKEDDDTPYDEAQPRGLAVDVTAPDNVGAALAHPVAGYPRNTILTPKILKAIQSQGVDDLLVRSPTVGGPADGGVYSWDVGEREKARGRPAPVGDYVGLAGAQSLSEPITQASISSKHSGGIVGASAGAISGFPLLNQLVQVPKVFQGGAVHAQADGKVTHVEAAPQGGNYVTVEGKKHYVNAEAPLLVKAGDTVEAGDVLSEGLPNPGEVVRHKGIGEGRKYFTTAFRNAMKDSGVSGHRRNIELLARGLINHVRLTEELDDWSPDDILPYQTLEKRWTPREGYKETSPAAAKGMYLESPVLHYSLGDKIRPSMLPVMARYGVKTVRAHSEPPPFVPEMVRGMANVGTDHDWMTRLLGSYQQKSLLGGVHRGLTSDEAGTSYVPALARGENFGVSGATKGWEAVSDKDQLQ